MQDDFRQIGNFQRFSPVIFVTALSFMKWVIAILLSLPLFTGINFKHVMGECMRVT